MAPSCCGFAFITCNTTIQHILFHQRRMARYRFLRLHFCVVCLSYSDGRPRNNRHPHRRYSQCVLADAWTDAPFNVRHRRYTQRLTTDVPNRCPSQCLTADARTDASVCSRLMMMSFIRCQCRLIVIIPICLRCFFVLWWIMKIKTTFITMHDKMLSTFARFDMVFS